MRLFLILIFLISNVAFTQQKLDILLNDPEFNCKKTKNTSFEKLANTFPLNKTVKVQIVSFEFKFLQIEETGKPDVEIVKDSLPRIGNKLDYKNLKEYKNLELQKIMELSNILYNFNFNTKNPVSRIAGCYQPRNAIVFLDSEDSILEFIELCFGCGGHYIFKGSHFGEFCDGKMQLIKNFFLLNGIVHGVIKE